MEKFRIAQYGLIQMVLLAYGILSAGTTVKISHLMWAPIAPPPIFSTLTLYRDYGIFLSFIIVAWACYFAFHSTVFSRRNVDEQTIVTTGMLLSGVFFVLGTFMLIGGIAHMFPPVSLNK